MHGSLSWALTSEAILGATRHPRAPSVHLLQAGNPPPGERSSVKQHERHVSVGIAVVRHVLDGLLGRPAPVIDDARYDAVGTGGEPLRLTRGTCSGGGAAALRLLGKDVQEVQPLAGAGPRRSTE